MGKAIDIHLDLKSLKTNLEFKLISNKVLAFSLRQLYELLNSGTNLYMGLDIVADLQDNNLLKDTYQEVKKDIEMGKPLYVAFNKKIFPKMLSNMLYAAETSENLENVFKTVADFLDNLESYKSKVISKAIYPSVVILFSVIAVLVSVNYVIPKIRDVLSSFGAHLPIVSLGLMYFAKLITTLIYISPILVLGFLIKERFVSKEILDRFYTKIPFFGNLIIYFEMTKFLYSLSLMLSSNSSMSISIKVSKETIKNSYVRSKLSYLEQDIYNGLSLSQAFSKTNIFKKSVISVVKSGEYTGDLVSAIKTAYKIYEQLLDKSINTFVSSLEPIATLLVGAIVSIVVLSIMVPIVDISSSVH